MREEGRAIRFGPTMRRPLSGAAIAPSSTTRSKRWDVAFARLIRRVGSCVLVTMLLITASIAALAASAPSAFAVGTVLFNQPFHDNTVDGPAGSVSIPATPTKTNVVYLSAAGTVSYTHL